MKFMIAFTCTAFRESEWDSDFSRLDADFQSLESL